MLVRSSCVLALTMMVLALQVSSLDEVDSEDERVKRQARQIRIGRIITNTQTQETMLTINGENTLVINDPQLRLITIDANTTVRHFQNTVFVMNAITMDSLPDTPISSITKFTFVDVDLSVDTQAQEFLTGPGVLYLQSGNALFVRSELAIQLIDNNRRAADPLLIPPKPVEIKVVQRVSPSERLVLNVDDTTDPPDGVAAPTDDIIDLTNSELYMISDRQSLIYITGTLLIYTGSVPNQLLDNIAIYYILQPTVQDGIEGLLFTQFNTLNISLPFLGPGELRVSPGMPGGQMIAFFSTVNEVNQFINSELVSMLLSFEATNVTAAIISNFPVTNQRLITLNGAQVFDFPSATRVEKVGSEISVFAGSRILQEFITDSVVTLSIFNNYHVESHSADVMQDLEDGGITLWFNIEDNEAFLYPFRNQIIRSGVNQAIQTANIIQPIMFATYSLSSDLFGFGLLSARVGDAEEFEVVNVAPARVFDVTGGETIRYRGGMLRIFRNGVRVEEFSISLFVVNVAGSEFISSDNSFFMTFGGPGRLYVDNRNRAFFTRNMNIQSFITSFVNSIPQPRIDVIRDPVERLVYFQTGGQNLFTLNGVDVTTTGLNTAAIYFNNQIDFVNRFNVPDNARVTYNLVRDSVIVEDPNSPGTILFEVDAGMLNVYDDRPTRPDTNVMPMVSSVVKDSDRFFFQNGNIYYGNGIVVVSSSNVVNSGISIVLLGLRSQESIQNIANLTSADGRSIITYSGSAPVVLPNGGTFYMLENEAMYIADRNFNFGVPRIFSQLNPAVTIYNRTSGMIMLRTSDGTLISSLRPGVTQVIDLSRSFSFTYTNGMIIFTSGSTQQFGLIDELIVWDGLMFITYTVADGNVTFSGPGIFWVFNGMAFFTGDLTTRTRLTQRINNVMRTFRPPIISRQRRTFTTKFSRSNVGGFPQIINLYNGADIDLNCTVLAANPPARITFSKHFLNETSGRIEVMPILEDDTTDNYDIIRFANTAILRIDGIMIDTNTINDTGTGVFTCVAENIVGSSSVSTTINVREARPPAIVTGFIPPLATVRNSSERLIAITSGDIGDELLLNPRRVIVEGIEDVMIERADDGTVIVRTLHIGCKGEGLPKSDITWFELIADDGSLTYETSLTSMDRMLVDDSSRGDVMISVPRGGRSVLTVELNPRSVACRRYICEATNLAGTALGGVDICPEFYNCEGTVVEGECSGTCGIGIALRRYDTCRIQGVTARSIEYEEIPGGLFPISPVASFCGLQRPSCPVITYQFVVAFDMGCSVTCGVGSIMRNITCQQSTTFDGVTTNVTVDDSFCAGQRRLPAVVTCRNNPPCPFWAVGEYGECSSTCRSGMSTRDVNCVQHMYNETTFELILDENNTAIITIVDDDLCGNGSRPVDTIVCNEHIPCPFRWRAGPWDLCSAQYIYCQQRTIYCERYDPRDFLWPGVIIDDSFCVMQDLIRPHSLRSCGGGVCGPGRWETQVTEECSVTCGIGRVKRRVFCVHPVTGLETADYFCNPFQRPSEVAKCAINCPGICVSEPSFCPVIRQLGCNRNELLSLAQQCCISCPKQGLPIII